MVGISMEDVQTILLRHPANCQLITHRENLIKAKKGHRYRDGNSINLKQLFNLIKKFKLNWYEQKLCLKTIKNYRGKQVVNGGKK